MFIGVGDIASDGQPFQKKWQFEQTKMAISIRYYRKEIFIGVEDGWKDRRKHRWTDEAQIIIPHKKTKFGGG